MKIAYIAHPIGGDVHANLQKIMRIARTINLREPDVVPFAPYFLDCNILNDSSKMERRRGIRNNIALFKSGVIDELRLYGCTISPGMNQEIKLANKYKIPIVVMNPTVKAKYDIIPKKKKINHLNHAAVIIFLGVVAAFLIKHFLL